MSEDAKAVIQHVKRIIDKFCVTNSAQNSVKFVLELDNVLYSISGNQSVRYGGGLHTKHKHIDYHRFFIDNIKDGESVLDIGCGIGAVADAIARSRGKSEVSGIDCKKRNIVKANQRYCRNNLSFNVGDALSLEYSNNFDVIVLSNVIEHIKDRMFLNKLVNSISPKKFLLRVPIFERDWRVPLKKELGLSYMLDETHVVELTQDKWFEEFEGAGLRVTKSKICWGELWAVAIRSL